MDILTDVLREAGLQRRLLDLRHLESAQALRFPCGRSIGLHIVRQGTLYIHAAGLPEPLRLHTGDIAIMARGHHHVLGSTAVLDERQIVSVAEPWPVSLMRSSEPMTAISVISGAYQFWNQPVHPLFQELPGWFVLTAASLPNPGSLSTAISLLDAELSEAHLGGDTIVHGLMDTVFTYLMREMVVRLGRTCAGWSNAMTDPRIRQVVDLMHGDSARAWTLEDLAALTGMSRTSLAERFRSVMGDTPLRYLRTLRMQKAMSMLDGGSRTLEQVAHAVGYNDAFGFSKVFKRIVGISPGAFRRQSRAEMGSPWKLHAG
jgi:AraC-like DNA-binding protein